MVEPRADTNAGMATAARRGPFRRVLSYLLVKGKGAGAYPVAGEISESASAGILIDVFTKAVRGLLLKPRLGACQGAPLVGRGARVRNARSVHCGRGFVLEAGAELQGLSLQGLRFGDNVTVGAGAQVRPSGYYGRDVGVGLRVGDDSNIGSQAYIGCSGGITIGKRVLMGPQVVILSEEHNLDDAGKAIKAQGVRHAPTAIQDEVWLGAHSTVMGGVSIGRGAVVAAGAVVTRDVPDGAVVAGVPASIIRRRGA